MTLPSPGRLRRVIGRFLGWFDEAEYNRERAATAHVLEAAEKVLTRDDRMRTAYRQYAERLDRR